MRDGHGEWCSVRGKRERVMGGNSPASESADSDILATCVATVSSATRSCRRKPRADRARPAWPLRTAVIRTKTKAPRSHHRTRTALPLLGPCFRFDSSSSRSGWANLASTSCSGEAFDGTTWAASFDGGRTRRMMGSSERSARTRNLRVTL